MFKIGALSKMLGLAPQTIRFYQNYGIVPHNTEKNKKPKQYSLGNFLSLIIARKYRACGFTLAESGELLLKTSIGELEDTLRNKSNFIEEEINRLTSVRAKLLQQEKDLSLIIADGVGKYEMTTIPNRYRMDYYILHNEKEPTIHNQDKIHAWVNLLPIAEIANFFPLDNSTLKYSGDNIFGFIIDEEHAYSYGVDKWNEAIFMEGGTALHVINEVPSINSSIEHFSEAILARALDMRLTPVGIPHTRLITSLYHRDDHPYYVHHWLPVKK